MHLLSYYSIIVRRAIMTLALLGITIPATWAYTTDHYAASSAFSRGKWVKIKVTGEGIHQITYDQLREWGFDNPESVEVYGFGGTALMTNTFDADAVDDVPQTLTLHRDDRLLFYGIGDVSLKLKLDSKSSIDATVLRNYYSTAGYYFVSDRQTAHTTKSPSMAAVSGDITRQAFQSHYCATLIENEVQNPSSAGALFHDKILSGVNEKTVCPFTIKDYYVDTFCKYKARFYNAFAAKNTSLTKSQHIVSKNILVTDSVTSNATGTSTASLIYSTGYYYGNFTQAKDLTTIPDGTYDFTIYFKSSGTPSYLAHDYCWMAYPRRNRLGDDSQMIMHFIKPGIENDFNLTDVPDNVVVWNITNPMNVYSHDTAANSDGTRRGSFDATYASNTECRLIAFNPDRTDFDGVEWCGNVANQDIHASKVPGMAIITTNTLYEKALELAAIHEKYDNITVSVYTQDEIFNEFSSGTPSAMAFRRFSKMLYDRDPQTYRYLLLYGPATWDNRGITTTYERENLIAYQTELTRYSRDTTRSFGHDSYYGMVQDTFDPTKVMFAQADIAVGRLPVSDAVSAAEVNDKIMRHMTAEPSAKAYATAIFLSDSGDSNQHYKQSEELISTMKDTCPALNAVKAHNLVFPIVSKRATQATKIIKEALSGGAGYFTYSGHADKYSFTENLLWGTSYNQSTEYTRYPLAMLATCSTFNYDRDDDDLGQKMLRAPNGGMIGVIAACRSVYLEYNQSINLAVGKAYASATADTRVGDIFRNARNSAVLATSDADEAVNVLCYNLGGDPAVKVNAPARTLSVTAINGEAPGTSPTDVAPLAPFTVSGSVLNDNGEIDTSFTGKVAIKLFDASYSVKTTDSSAGKLECELDQETLAETAARVENGEFTARLFSPVPMHSGTANRIMLSAVSDDGKTVALGTSRDVHVLADNTQPAEATAPVITDMYIGDESFADGDIVRGDVELHAVMQLSESGIRVASAIGAAASLTLDGNTTYPAAALTLELHDDGTATIDYPISGIEDGRHTLCLKVADNAGNTSSRTIAFTLVNTPAAITLSADKTTARSAVEFDIDHTFSSTPDARLVIRDKDNNTVFSRASATFPLTWELTDNNGDKVPDGYYSAFVIANSDGSFASSTPIAITVIRRVNAD